MMTMDEFRKSFIEMAQMRIDVADATLESFTQEFAKEPWYALEWSISAFEAAAEKRAYGLAIKMMVNADCTLEDMLQFSMNEALRGARYPKASTAQPMNVMHQQLTAAWAQMADLIRGFVQTAKANEKATKK